MLTSSSTRRCIQFSLEEIKAATNQFDSGNLLGEGGEAKVYSAKIYIDSSMILVAVKHLKDKFKEFEKEIHTLSNIQHPNIVSLIGYCDESGHKILVYEYMANGCLSDYLKKKSHSSLSWLQRLSICLGVARGLQHLHSETVEFGKGIIHRDMKPGNILLDENWVGKVSDFGMFKFSNAGQDKSLMTTNLKGTRGYYAPEYIRNGRVTRKIDVYAFGVVLFQVLCHKMPWDREDDSFLFKENDDLGIWAHQNVDAQIHGEMKGDSLRVFTVIIGRCLQKDPGERPTMDNVVLDLQKALECQNSENLPIQLEVFTGFQYPVGKYVGPWGGEGGENQYNFKVNGTISHICIKYEGGIHSIRFTSQDEKGHLETSRKIGGPGGHQTAEIVLDTNSEKLVGISGTVGIYDGFMVITSLKFYTSTISTNRSFGPFGGGAGTPFSYMAEEGCSVTGFYGHSGGKLDSIGLHVQVTTDVDDEKMLLAGRDSNNVFEQKSDLEVVKKMMESYYVGNPEHTQSLMTQSVGPWGGKGGENSYDFMFWGKLSNICIKYECGSYEGGIYSIRFTSQQEKGNLKISRKIGGPGGDQTAEIVLDTNGEMLVGISGTVGIYTGYTVITSLTFYTSTNRSFGPFSGGTGTPFSYKADKGCSIIGFYGRSGGLLDSIGLHVQVTTAVDSEKLLLAGKNVTIIFEQKSYPEVANKLTESYYMGDIERTHLMTQSVGPWGGNSGEKYYDYMFMGKLSHICIKYEGGRDEGGIHSISFTSQHDKGQLKTSRKIGGAGGNKRTEIVLDTMSEKLVGISGTVGPYKGFMVITSLKFYTSTNRLFGPFGLETGTRFSHMVDEGFIIGFYGRTGALLNSIGLHVQVTPDVDDEVMILAEKDVMNGFEDDDIDGSHLRFEVRGEDSLQIGRIRDSGCWWWCYNWLFYG